MSEHIRSYSACSATKLEVEVPNLIVSCKGSIIIWSTKKTLYLFVVVCCFIWSCSKNIGNYVVLSFVHMWTWCLICLIALNTTTLLTGQFVSFFFNILKDFLDLGLPSTLKPTRYSGWFIPSCSFRGIHYAIDGTRRFLHSATLSKTHMSYVAFTKTTVCKCSSVSYKRTAWRFFCNGG